MLLHEVSGFKAGVAKNVCDVSRRDVTAEKFKSELIQNQACSLYVFAWFQLKSLGSIGDSRFECEYENDYSVPLCRLHIIHSQTHFMLRATFST